MAGRPPKPEALKELQGRPGRRRAPPVTSSEAGAPLPLTPPKELKAGARQLWEKQAPELVRLRFLRPSDAQAFARYCEHLVSWWTLTQKLKKEGWTYTSQSQHGELKRVNPTFLVRDRVEGRLQELEDRFGLNARARQELLKSLAHAPGTLPLPEPEARQPEPETPPAPEQSPIGFLGGGSVH